MMKIFFAALIAALVVTVFAPQGLPGLPGLSPQVWPGLQGAQGASAGSADGFGIYTRDHHVDSAESADDAGYYIRDYHVEVVAGPDRRYDVVETIDVWFEEPSKGIVRNIPRHSWLERFEIIDFRAVGEPFILEREGYMRIGDEGAEISGLKTYTIKYTLAYYADDDPTEDRFFMNIIGTEWPVRIENFSACVTLPEGAAVEEYAITTEAYGKQGYEVAGVSVTGNVITMESLQELPPWSGVTLDVRLPEGTFYAAGEWAPPLEVERLDVTVDINEYGVMSVTENYKAKVNSALVFERAITDFKGIGDQVKKTQDVDYYVSDGQGSMTRQPPPFMVTPYKVLSIDIIGPEGRQATGSSAPEQSDHAGRFDKFSSGAGALDLSGYAGRTVEFSISYMLENRLRENMDEVGFYIQLMKGFYTDMRVDDLNVTVNAPFDIHRLYGGGGGTQRAILGEPAIDGGRLTAQSIEPFESQDISYVVEFKNAAFIRKANTIDIALPAILLAAMLCVLFFAFLHRREKPPVPVIEFSPPQGMSPAEVGYVIDERVSGRDVTSLIYYWASQGRLRIETLNNRKYVLHLLSGLDAGRPDYERAMFSALWKLGAKRRSVTSDELKDKFHSVLKSTAAQLKKSFSGERGLYRKGRSPLVATSFLLMCMGFVAFVIMGQFVDYVAGVLPMRPLFIIYGRFGEYEDDFYVMFVFVLFSLLASMYLATNFYRSDRVLKTAAGAIRRIICLALAIAGTLMFTLVCGDGKMLLTVSAAISAASLYAVVNALPFIARLSDYGVYARGLCLGFKMFLVAAEKQRFEMLLEENPDYYYDILPYAQVLGVSKLWQSKFDRLLINPSSWFFGEGLSGATYSSINAINREMYKRRRRKK